MAFPTSLTNAIDGTTEIVAEHLNNLEAKVGVDGSSVVTSLDYLLKNSLSSNPGHTHTLANGATDVTATATELNYLSGVTSGVQAQLNGKLNLTGGTLSGLLTLQNKLALGTVTTQTFDIEIEEAKNSGLGIRLINLDTGTGAYTQINPQSNYARLYQISHGSGRTLTRFGLTLGGWAEISVANGASGSANGLILGTQTAVPVVLGTNNAERIRIDSGGNVGINTTTPIHPVDILVSSFYGLRVMSTATLGAGSGGTVALYANNIPTAADQRMGRFVFGMYDQPTGNFAESAIVAAFSEETWVYATNRGTYLRFETVPPGGTTRTEKFRISGAGNIGISQTTFGASATKVLAIGNGTAPTSSPADAVQLWSADRGGSAGKAGLHVRSEDGTSHVFSDYVGIGTTTPTVPLDVAGAGQFAGHLTPAANDTYTCGSSSYRWSYLYGARANLVYSVDDPSTTTCFNLTFYPTYRNTGTYYSRGQVITYYINTNDDLTANNSGYDKALHIIAYLRNDSGILTELTALQLDYGAYGLSAADLTGTITNAYGIRIAAQKVASATITNNYGIHLAGIAGTNTWGIYQSQTGLTGNLFNSNVMIGGTGIVGTSGAKVLAMSNGTAPTSSPADAVQLWSADRGGTAGKAGLHIRSEDGTSHVFSDYVGIGTTTPSYLLDVASGNVRITQNIGIGSATPSTYNNAGSESSVLVSRSHTDATTSAVKRGVSSNVTAQPSAEAALYYQAVSAIVDVATATAYNLNGYVMAVQSVCYHRANTTLNAMYGVYVYPAIYNSGSDSTGTITNLYGVYIGSAKTASSTITTAYGLFITGITGTTAYDIYCGGASNKNYFAGSVGIGTTTFGTSATKTLAIGNGTAPSSSPADLFQLYSADQTAGNACPHFRTEGGAVIKLFQGAALTSALTTITYTAPGTPDYAVQDLTNSSGYGFATKDEGNTVLSIIANLQARVNELEARLQAHGLLA